MRKFIIAIVCSIACSINLSAQTVDDFFKNFKDKKGVECLEIPKAMMSMAAEKANKDNKKNLIKKIDNIRILQIEDNPSLCKEFGKKAAKLKKNGYETMVNSTEENEKVLVLVKSEGETITELVILEIEPDECALVEMKGNFNSSDIQNLESIANH